MGFKLLYEQKNGTAKILRCFGEAEEISLPAFVHGCPVTEIGDYIFSAGMRTEPFGYLWEEGCQKLPVRKTAASELGPAFCGDRVREISLPPELLRIGRYAFYNCDGLRRLQFSSGIRDIGAGAFNGCRKIEELTVTENREEKSCLKEILSELNETVAVHYLLTGPDKDRPGSAPVGEENRAELLFPAFYEEAVENTPARITETHVHGCGHRYRYCFQNTRFQFAEYDSLFPYMKVQENVKEAVRLSVGRLRFPMELSEKARCSYRAYLLEHLEETAEYICSLQDVSEWRWLVNECFGIIKVEHAAAGWLGNEGLAGRAHEEYSNIKEPALDKTGFDKLIHTAVRRSQTEAVSFLMDAGRRAFPPKRKKFEL